MQQMLNKAIVLAATHHDGQFDKSGLPYILHVMKVMHYLKSNDEELNCIAVLHDIIEDTSCTFQDLIDAGMSERVECGVRLLTKQRGQRYMEEYLDGIASNPDAIRVKMADLRHNMDVRRLKGVTDKDMQRIAKYSRAYNFLDGALAAHRLTGVV